MAERRGALRWRRDTGFEWRCYACGEHWPVDDRESWLYDSYRDGRRKRTFTRCRACRAEGRLGDPYCRLREAPDGGLLLRCHGCEIWKPLTTGYYHLPHIGYARCRACHVEAMRRYRRANAEAVRASDRARYDSHAHSVWRRQHYQECREAELAYARRYRATRTPEQREAIQAKKRAAHRARMERMTPEERLAAREVWRQRGRAWRERQRLAKAA